MQKFSGFGATGHGVQSISATCLSRWSHGQACASCFPHLSDAEHASLRHYEDYRGGCIGSGQSVFKIHPCFSGAVWVSVEGERGIKREDAQQ